MAVGLLAVLLMLFLLLVVVALVLLGPFWLLIRFDGCCMYKRVVARRNEAAANKSKFEIFGRRWGIPAWPRREISDRTVSCRQM